MEKNQDSNSAFLNFLVGDVDFKMIKVEGGTFTMGATPEQGDVASDIEKPAHQVTLSDYYIGQFQVTQELWESVTGSNPSWNKNPSNPVDNVSWDDIVNDFLPKLNALTGLSFSLPTEAQWEFAARGGNASQGYEYSGSNNPDEVAWYQNNSDNQLHLVGQKLPNELGIYDMSGNVNELCCDYLNEYSSEKYSDFLGPALESSRVCRGGSYSSTVDHCRISYRHSFSIDDDEFCGFRLVLSDILSLSKKHLTLPIGKSETLSINVNGIDFPDLNGVYSWKSSDLLVAYVDSKGKVKPLRPGSVVISAVKEDIVLSCCIDVFLPEPSLIVTANGVDIPLIKVDAGTFSMGSTPEQRGYDEVDLLVHRVTLSDYYIGQFLVTQELWEAVMGSNPSRNKHPKNPVENVSWYDIVNDFLPKLNALTGKTFTLPTEAQWEFAARGGNKSNGYMYSGSNDLLEVASNCTIHTLPVGGMIPNELGIYDMSGNVMEWCLDYWSEYDSASKIDPIVIFEDTSSNTSDWVSLEQEVPRISRGGFFQGWQECHDRVCYRACGFTGDQNGFRLVLSDNIYLNKVSLQLHPGQSNILHVFNSRLTSIKSGITWTSSVPSVADIDANGNVTALSAGFSVITARVNNTGKEVSCNVEVLALIKPSMNFFVNGVNIPLIKVDGGTFTMGASPEQGDYALYDAKPAHQVTLSDYYIGQYEVTQELWEAVMGTNPSWNKNPANPVEKVSWDDIVNDFLPKLNALTGKNFTLPTEAQWEFAARGGNRSKGYKFSGSNNIDDVAWYRDNSNGQTHQVGLKKPNELGIYDMSGNVDEWCSDWYEGYSAEAQTNPTGPASGSSRVLRGGDGRCRVSHRNYRSPVCRNCDYGFRLALFL